MNTYAHAAIALHEIRLLGREFRTRAASVSQGLTQIVLSLEPRRGSDRTQRDTVRWPRHVYDDNSVSSAERDSV
jgi:hypothetical protein